MWKNYLKIAQRNLLKNKASSIINIGGLAVGLAVAMLIGLWVWDELSFDQDQTHYRRIAQVWQFVTFEKDKVPYQVVPVPLSDELKHKYPEFEAVSMSSFTRDAILAAGDKKLTQTGNYVQPDFAEIVDLKMLSGQRQGLQDLNSILLSESAAKAMFGDADPLDEVIKMNNKVSVKVAGVYADFPGNSSFKDLLFLAPWDLLAANDAVVKNAINTWDENSHQIFVQLKPGADFAQVSAKIKDIRMKLPNPPSYKPEFFLHPMSSWHLYSSFTDGEQAGGLIQFVWLFGAVGLFVLLLACVNFMNLSTARAEKRAKEVGIRKSIGSSRGQLVGQFFYESFSMVALAFGLALLLVELSLPFFNELVNKKVALWWSSPVFWLVALSLIVLTSVVAGSYPAFYLSSFRPIKVLKGTFRTGRFAGIPRKVLVTFQYTVSIALIIGTMVIFGQIQFAKSRAVGYDRQGLIEINMKTPELQQNYEALRNDLLRSGAVQEVSKSFGSITADFGGVTNFAWPGKAEDFKPLVMANRVSHEFGRTVGWKLLSGRDFSKDFATDTSSIILNEAAWKLTGLAQPIDQLVKWGEREYRVVGVIQNIIKESPFETIKPSFFVVSSTFTNVINIKLAANLGTSAALAKVGEVVKKHNPAGPFEYSFVDDEFARKFDFEERIGNLAAFFALLAIFISCLGLFGLISFVAEQRTKEIGIRKVLGASVLNLWSLLSKDFVILVAIASLIAIPVTYHYLNEWLNQYSYHIEISWWIFAVAGLLALGITLLTVSYQGIRAALANPVKSLRSE